MCAFTVIEREPRYLLEPLVVKATLAPQQEGSGVTIHLDALTVAISKKQVHSFTVKSHDIVHVYTVDREIFVSKNFSSTIFSNEN
jgi:hypothetical protein